MELSVLFVAIYLIKGGGDRMLKTMVVFDPDSPGMKVKVVRNFIQRILYPKNFATLSETIRHYAFMKKGIDYTRGIKCTM